MLVSRFHNLFRVGLVIGFYGLLTNLVACRLQAEPEPHPLTQGYRDRIQSEQSERVKTLTKRIAENPKSEQLYSNRGDALFFLGQFKQAVSDYDEMVKLNPDLETSHWRRGIAFFYAGEYEKAAHQFEIYHSFDNVDRENGIWRYLSQHRAFGEKKAREGLLKYQKDDREPFPAVYELFAGKITADEILKQINAAQIDDPERQKRLFYAELYIGLNYSVERQPAKAHAHLRAATANEWPVLVGGGPGYMWHVGRLHYDMLTRELQKKEAEQKP